MHNIFYFSALIFLSEFVVRLNIFELINLSITIVKKILLVLSNKKIGDDYKEKFIIKYSLKLLKFNIILFVKLIFIFTPLILFFILFPSKTYIFFSPFYLATSVLVIVVYFKIKKFWLSIK